MSSSDAFLRDIIAKLDNLEARMTDGQHKLEAGQARLEAGQHKLEEGLSRQWQQIMALDRAYGSVIARQLRDEIRHKFGERYALQLLAKSLVDFCDMFSEYIISSRRKNRQLMNYLSSDLPPR